MPEQEVDKGGKLSANLQFLALVEDLHGPDNQFDKCSVAQNSVPKS